MEDALALCASLSTSRSEPCVLILVVMEDALARDEDSLNNWPCCVLILVVMEDALALKYKLFVSKAEEKS